MDRAFLRQSKWALFLSIAFFVLAGAQSQSETVVAYVKGSTLTFATRSGQATKTIRLTQPVFDFAISPEQKWLVTVVPTTTYGGPLELVRIDTGHRSRLVSGPVYFKHLPKVEKEVYADPRFSPDGRYVAFAVHVNSPGDGNDLVNAAGPIAIVNISTRLVHILKSTTKIPGIPDSPDSLCFANTPLWSPDGKQMLFSCETGALITDQSGDTPLDLSMGTEQKPWTGAIGWVGKNCVLYVQATDGDRYETYEARLLNLHTSKSQEATAVLPGFHGPVSGLIEASSAVRVRRVPPGLQIDTPMTTWTLPKGSTAHVLGG